MRTSVDGIWRRRDLATRARHRRHRRHAGRIHFGHLPYPGKFRCCRANRTPKKEGISTSVGTGYRPDRGRLTMIGRHGFIAIMLLLLTGCTVGPKYKRPPVTVPGAYRGLAPDSDPQTIASLGDEKWWAVFQDEQLQALIREALAQNYDVRIAAVRVLQAHAALGITRADQFPTISAGASATNERFPRTRVTPAFETSPLQVNLGLAWELDFWGKCRRATEAARAELRATEWGQKAVVASLVSSVATAYFQLLELDSEMEISRRALDSRKESLRLVEIREKGGTTSMMDVRQSEQLVYTASASIPDLERRIEQQENLISLLLGRNPGVVKRGLSLVDNVVPPEVPAGVPSSLLSRRPDIQSAEQTLIAANARIGVAKAAYFPQITLTGLAGFQSAALTSLFTGPAGLWSFGGQLVQPLFTAGKIRSGVRLTEAQQQEAVLIYQQSIQQAFREVSDSLVAYRKNREFREQEALLTNSAGDATHLADSR